MTRLLGRFPDVEALLCVLLDGLTTGEAVTTLPANLQDVLPLQRIRRIGGADDRITDVARVDVEAYAATRAQALTLAEQQRQRLLAVPGATVHGLIDRVETEVGPHQMPYTDPAVRLLQATYRISVRRWPAAPYELPAAAQA